MKLHRLVLKNYRGIEHREAFWRPLQQLAPKKIRVGARRMRQLVDEALLEEGVLR